MPFAIPFWLKIVGPLVGILIVMGSIAAWSHHQYSKGEKAGEAKVDKQWADADAKLHAQAAASATRADDAAAARAVEFHQQADSDRKAVEDAQAKGSSPLDAIFGN